MAIYRPEQAQLTYGPEAAFAADSELAKGKPVSSGWTGTITETSAGALEITLTQASNNAAPPTVGDFIQIGATTSVYGQSITNHEIRRIEWFEATGNTREYVLGLDRPTGFYHEASAAVTEIDGIYVGTSYGKSKLITNLPGVYETVDVPDMESSMEAQFFLGTTNKRSFQTIIKNQQTYDTSLTMTPLDGKPFRWAIGKVTTCAEDMNSVSTDQTTINNSNGVKKGDSVVRVDNIDRVTTMPGSGSGIQVATAGDYITFTDSTDVSDNADIEAAVALMGSNPESRRVVYGRSASGLTGDGYIWLDQPLQFDHADNTKIISHGVTTATKTFRHVISETDSLDTMSWHIHMKDSAETGKTTSGSGETTHVNTDSDFDRRYTGGKVGSATITAEESGLVSVSWDTINFRGMHHNNRNHAGVTTSNSPYNGANVAANMPFFALMQDIQMSDVDYPSTEPYYFSDGQLTFFGTVFAQIRSFSLSINNNTEPRYYIQRSFGKFRGPNEIREQRREYGLTATVVIPDAADHTGAGALSNATSLFRELLLEGDYGKPSADIIKGFHASLRFDRGTGDYLIIDIPNSQAPTGEGKPLFVNAGSPAANHGDSVSTDVGLFIRSAAHNLTTDAPLQVELDMLFKNLVIYIKDNEPSYI